MGYSSRLSSARAAITVIGCLVVGTVLYVVSTLDMSRVIRTSSTTLQSPSPGFSAYEHKVMYPFPGLDLYPYRAYIDDRFNETNLRIFALEKKNNVTGQFWCSWMARRDGVDIEARVQAHK